MVGCSLVGILLAIRFSPSERLVFLRFLFRFLTIASLLCILLFPSYGIGYLKTNDHILHHEWNGLFVAKNRLGGIVGLSALIDSYSRMTIWKYTLWYGIYLLLLVRSDSMTPLASLLVTFVVIACYNHFTKRRRLSDKAAVSLISAALTPLLFIGLGTGILQAALGKDASLSGRTTIWQLSLPLLSEHPLLGFGYDGLFRGASNEFYVMARQMNWPISSAHNGYLEIALDLGLIGSILTAWFLWQGGIAALRHVRTADDTGREVTFPLALVVYFLVSNLAEATILSSTILWTVLLGVILNLLPRRQSAHFCVRTLAPASVSASDTS
jgi:O-antigen ligase